MASGGAATLPGFMRFGRRKLAVALSAAATGFMLVTTALGRPIELPADPTPGAGVSSLQATNGPLQVKNGPLKPAEPRASKPKPPPIPLAVKQQLETIASCESGGDPRAVSSDGTYRGKYQFDRGTWASVGGDGDPAKAPESEQDRRAAKLLAQSGSSPWPVCG
jgi:hypothetical protein